MRRTSCIIIKGIPPNFSARQIKYFFAKLHFWGSKRISWLYSFRLKTNDKNSDFKIRCNKIDINQFIKFLFNFHSQRQDQWTNSSIVQANREKANLDSMLENWTYAFGMVGAGETTELRQFPRIREPCTEPSSEQKIKATRP